MESARPTPAAPNRSKLSQTLKRAILSKKPTKNSSASTGFCLPIIADGKKARCFFESHRKHLERETAEAVEESRARAFVARLFAAVSSIKAAYAELQTAQLPYDAAAVKTADQAVVDELKLLSELKRRFLKDQIGSSPPHIFTGFDSPSFSNEGDNRFPAGETRPRRAFFEDFRRLRSVGAAEYLDRNPDSAFGEYLRCKYLKLVHPKMEFSFWGNLSRRKTVGSGGFPAGEFFAAFAEVCRRVWLLHRLAFSFEEEVRVFRVGKGSRFSDVYMDGVTDGGGRVAFTVVPGFEFGRTVVQSQVYLFPR
ncbi:Plant protein of unknown function (DUF641 [Striga hermonthica]|uniref:DUF641 domain-containing protein n=1 Tax=Striga hermonthica TaxID=68872 RepID=A0A9N7NLX6_STRHE|nr:Plant protein of unknown function (DUF641 [Striga hermonthica]